MNSFLPWIVSFSQPFYWCSKKQTNKQTNKLQKSKLFVSVSKSHDDVGYLLDHSVSSSPQRPRLRCTLPFLWPTIYGCCSMFQAWYVVLFFFKAVHLALNSFPWWWRYIYPFSPHRFTVIWNEIFHFKPRHMLYSIWSINMWNMWDSIFN